MTETPFIILISWRKKNCTHAKPNWKTRTETIYRYTPNIYLFFLDIFFLSIHLINQN